MDERSRKQLDELKRRLRKKFQNMAEPMDKVEYTRENYDQRYPNGKVATPIGERQLRGDQFVKLGTRDNGKRKKYIGGMAQTYNDPIAIIQEDRMGKKSKIFGKSFDNLSNEQILMNVVNHKNKGVSTHERELNNFLNKIKSPSDLVYEKPTRKDCCNDREAVIDRPADRTAGILDSSLPADARLPTNIPQTNPIVNGKKDKDLRKE
jgi:hypothetical protein